MLIVMTSISKQAKSWISHHHFDSLMTKSATPQCHSTPQITVKGATVEKDEKKEVVEAEQAGNNKDEGQKDFASDYYHRNIM